MNSLSYKDYLFNNYENAPVQVVSYGGKNLQGFFYFSVVLFSTKKKIG